MDAEFFKTVGQIAGIGGVAFGVFLILFREVIRKNIFSNLGAERSYRLMQQILYLVWSIAALGIVVWAVTQKSEGANQSTSGRSSPNIKDVKGNVDVKIH